MSAVFKRLSGTFSRQQGDPDIQKLKKLAKKPYRDQAIWFLNAFWNKPNGPKFAANPENAETVWKYCQTCAKLDPQGDEGNELDEVLAHRLFEQLESTLTVMEMREAMRKVDVDFNKFVSLFEFLIYRFSIDWKVLVNAEHEQGENMEEVLKETQELWEKAQKELEECQQLADDAKAAETEAIAKEAVFAEAEEKAVELENAQREEERKVAETVAELQAEEKAHADAISHLETRSSRLSIGIVQRGKAKNELAQLKATETTGLVTAKLNQEAALRRQQKATKLAASARVAATKARKPFEEAKIAAATARAEADEAVETSIAAFKEAEASLESVKAKFQDAGRGTFWWMDRELEEAKKYMSKKQLAALERSQS